MMKGKRLNPEKAERNSTVNDFTFLDRQQDEVFNVGDWSCCKRNARPTQKEKVEQYTVEHLHRFFGQDKLFNPINKLAPQNKGNQK